MAIASLTLGSAALVAAACTAGGGRHARMGFGPGLSEQSVAQRAARVVARHRRECAAGFVRLPAEAQRHRTDGFNYASTLSDTVSQSGVSQHRQLIRIVARDFGSRGIGATATQTLYNGFQTANRTRQAESQVMGARETLRVTEQQVLLDAATAYMNLLRDQAILDLNRRNVEVLTEQLKQTRDRFNVGEVTRTDVAQAESRLAAGRSALLGAQSNFVTSQANYRRVIGVDPGQLAPGTPVDRLSPPTLPGAITQGEQQSPSVLAAMYGVDIAELAVKISEGALYPNLVVDGERCEEL